MKKHNKLYLGRAGELYIVSEFLLKNWNAAIPEIDSGVDIFVVKDAIGDFLRVQVKQLQVKKQNMVILLNLLFPMIN